MDRTTYLSYSDPEEFTVSSSDRAEEPLKPRQNMAFWRGKKHIVIITIIILAIFAAGIVIGVVVGITRGHHTDQPPPSRTSSSANSSKAAPALPPTSAPGPIPSPQPIPATLAAAFRSSSWIWQDSQALMSVPSGNWAFRKTLPASTVPAKEATVLLTVDNGFQLYHNGQLIAKRNSTLGWKMAKAVQIDLDPNSNVFAVQARNSRFGAGPNGNSSAGLLASIQISYADDTTTTISSDDTWRVTQPVPDGFQSPSFDDTQWQFAATLVNYGLGPWGNITIPPQVSHFPAH